MRGSGIGALQNGEKVSTSIGPRVRQAWRWLNESDSESCDPATLDALETQIRHLKYRVWLIRMQVSSAQLSVRHHTLRRTLLEGSDFNGTELQKEDWWMNADGDVVDGQNRLIFSRGLNVGGTSLEKRRILLDLESRLTRVERRLFWTLYGARLKQDMREARKMCKALARTLYDRVSRKS